MKTNKWASAILLCAIIGASALLTAPGCSSDASPGVSGSESSAASPATADGAVQANALSALGINPGSAGVNPNVLHDASHKAGFQLEAPAEGDTIAVLSTDLGDITLRFFPDQAPKAVTNFINLARSGAYNNTYFYKVLRGCAAEGGRCGTGPDNPNGISSYGAQFEDEFCDSLFNLRGAVSMVSSARDTNGSSFLINDTTAKAFAENGGWSRLESEWETFRGKLVDYKDSNLLTAFLDENGDRLLDPGLVPPDVKKLYEENGGNPLFDGAYNAADRGCTVFAQVIEGMEVADKIAAAEVGENNAPLQRVTIKSVTVTAYKAPPSTR